MTTRRAVLAAWLASAPLAVLFVVGVTLERRAEHHTSSRVAAAPALEIGELLSALRGEPAVLLGLAAAATLLAAYSVGTSPRVRRALPVVALFLPLLHGSGGVERVVPWTLMLVLGPWATLALFFEPWRFIAVNGGLTFAAMGWWMILWLALGARQMRWVAVGLVSAGVQVAWLAELRRMRERDDLLWCHHDLTAAALAHWHWLACVPVVTFALLIVLPLQSRRRGAASFLALVVAVGVTALLWRYVEAATCLRPNFADPPY